MFHKRPFSGSLQTLPAKTPDGFQISVYDAIREETIEIMVPASAIGDHLLDTFAALTPGTQVHGDSTRDISCPTPCSVATKITSLELSLASFQMAIDRKTRATAH